MTKSSTIFFLFVLLIAGMMNACSPTAKLLQAKHEYALPDSALAKEHYGVALYDITDGKYLYQYNSSKYFIPCSNTKLFTLYTAMKTLGDSIPAAKIAVHKDTVFVVPTGDPTFLNDNFSSQPFLRYLKQFNVVCLVDAPQQFSAYAQGWAWDDYSYSFMPERSVFPIYSNVLRFYKEGSNIKSVPPLSYRFSENANVQIARDIHSNNFYTDKNNSLQDSFTTQKIPFITSLNTVAAFLRDTLNNPNVVVMDAAKLSNLSFQYVYAQAADVFYASMMYRSDNFLAEQLLLMSSYKQLGVMNDTAMIRYATAQVLSDMPQRLRWVDGSGLSRYNLCTPEDLVYVLLQTEKDFGWNRLTAILPTGGTGTLKKYFLDQKEKIYAKTGSLSNNFCLSGILLTNSHKKIAFSIMVNNTMRPLDVIRKEIEQYLVSLSKK